MKIGKIGLVCLVIVALTVSLWIPSTNHMVDNSVSTRPPLDAIVAYEFHYQISILGDEDFETQANAEAWDGDGSSETPYLIQGYLIAGNTSNIWIEDTTVHFKIINCYLHTAVTDFTLWNVTNAVIENCMFKYSTTAVHLFNCTTVAVVNCTISEVQDGIFIEDCINCYIGGSTIIGKASSESGIDGLTNTGLEIYNNTISDWDDHGIQLYQCTDIEINNNTLYWNEGWASAPGCGISINESNMLSILGNNITENVDNGIDIRDTPNVSIIQNHIIGNDRYGIFLSHSDYCYISGNLIAENGNEFSGGGGIGIGTCEYPQIIDNILTSNTFNGISILGVEHLLISGNLLENNYLHGIDIDSNTNTTIIDNEIYNSQGLSGGEPFCGIYVYQCADTDIINNTLGNNSENGIYLRATTGNVIGNTIYGSEFNGIWADYTSWFVFRNNIIYDNGGPALSLLDFCADNLVYNNDFGWSGEFLVSDYGMRNEWNNSNVGNWYSDYGGTGTYSIYGPVSSIDYYPSMNLYHGVAVNLTAEAGVPSNIMIWNSSALNPWKYEVLADEMLHETIDWGGSDIEVDVSGFQVGVYNITVVVYHISGHWQSNSSTLEVIDTMAPTWTITPPNHNLEYGTPFSYDINASDPSGIDEWWLTGDIGFAIDGIGIVTNTTPLDVGVYTLTVFVNDTYGHSTFSEFSINVSDTIFPVWVTTPVDQEINQGETFSYQLSATDLAGIDSWSVNDTINFAISQNGLITNATIMGPGIYWLNIQVSDGHLNTISVTIKVLVNEVLPTETITTTTTTTTTTPTTTIVTPPPIDTGLLGLSIGGAGVVIIVIVVAIAMKKRSA